MKTDLIDKNGKEGTAVDIPLNFSKQIRKDIVLKVFEAKKIKQPHGTYIYAGKLYSASGIIGHKRHSWKVSYGRGISRVPRKIMSRDGTSFNWVGATVAGTRGGRRAHPPKSWENQFRKINKKEMLIAINSSLSATADKRIVDEKYKIKISKKLPLVVSSEVLKLETKKFYELLEKIFGTLNKVLKERKVRAGKGKLRGRRYKTNAGLLFVIGDNEKLKINGIDIIKVKDLRLKDLAPNGVIGRLSIYTEDAIKEIGKRFNYNDT
jgi:large subunit ribosomal protein L4e